MTINNRIDLIISELGLNNNSFSKAIAVNPTIIHNIIKGRNSPSFDILYKIALAFDNIDMNWLITGNGNMMLSEENIGRSAKEIKEVIENNFHKIDCEMCKLKDTIIASQEREISTLTEFLNFYKKS